MSNLTKKAINNSFMKLLDRKPIDRITIKDITDDCGISRNTFYYHYADMPTLVEEMIMEDADELIKQYPSIESLEECLNVAAEFVLKNKRAAKHIYNSPHRYIYERCLMKICRHVIATYFNIAVPGDFLTDEERGLMIEYYKCMSFGIIIDWCDSGMKDDYALSFKKLLDLRLKLMGSELSI